MRGIVIVFGAVLAIATSVPANSASCKSANSQLEMNLCAAKAYKITDSELNQVYRELMDRLSPTGQIAIRKKLIAAQKAWIAFRDGECSFASAAAEGGSIYPLVFTNCLDALTRRRIADLRTFLTCNESDSGCPVPAN